MDPLEPTTSTLSPAISHIVEITSTLAATQPKSDEESSSSSRNEIDAIAYRRQSRAKVQTLLSVPRILRGLVQDGKRDQAIRQWDTVKPIFEKWEARGIRGATELKNAALETLDQSSAA